MEKDNKTILLEIKEKAAILAGLDTGLNCEASGNPYEMRRIARRVFNHFGLDDEVRVERSTAFPGCRYHFSVGEVEVVQYRVYATTDLQMGHANVASCILDMLSFAFSQRHPTLANDFEQLFDPYVGPTRLKYSR